MDRQRIDKWLWAARFYKTRSAATDAIAKGQVEVNGQKPKPSRNISAGDSVSVFRTPYLYELTVLGLNEHRRPAAEAQTLYEESDNSIAARADVALQQKTERMVNRGLSGDGRPSKRQRRQIIRFQTTGSDSPDES